MNDATSLFPHVFADRTADAIEAEAFETDRWAADAIIRVELLPPRVLDPCCGHGILSEAASKAGYAVTSRDLYDWGYGERPGHDFLASTDRLDGAGVFMNPPFSRAVEFVRHAQALGARKIVAFQRFSWRESDDRKPFWRELNPNRVYVCADRASCWRFDISAEERKDRSSTPTTHAWFIWERGHPPGCLLWQVEKP